MLAAGVEIATSLVALAGRALCLAYFLCCPLLGMCTRPERFNLSLSTSRQGGRLAGELCSPRVNLGAVSDWLICVGCR